MTAGRGEIVLGVGVDIVEIGRVRTTLRHWNGRFRRRVFLPAEQRYCEGRPAPWRHYAVRFALKEAVSKAFGTGIGAAVGWLDIEVLRAESGAPAVALTGAAAALARRRGVRRVHVSLAHAREYAVAQAILTGEGEHS